MASRRNPIRKYLVVTPTYPYVDVIFWGQGPTYEEADVIEVEAHTKREAIIAGVREMRKQPGYHYHRKFCDGNPFAGVKAYLVEEEVEDG